MNKSMLALIVGGVLTGGAAQAEIRDDAWYVGGKIGWSSYFDVDQKQVVADTLGELENTHSGKDALGLGGFAGYQVNPNLAFEFGYDWLGKYTSSGELSGVNIAAEAKSQMVQATMKMGFPVNPLIEPYGRIGGGYAWTHSNLSAEAEGNYVSEKRKDHGAVFVGALGAEYALNERLAARLEYQYTTPLGDASLDRAGIEMDNGLLSLGVRYRLNQAEVVAPAPAPAPAEQVPVVEQKTFSLSSDVLFEF
ncbi:MAG: outer membrane beta-barrel protein, partial [Aeromonas sp.]